jgi:hypothetical protein
MIYEIINQPKRLETALFDKAVSFACKFLDIDIDIDLIIEFETLQKHQCGYCDYDEDEVIITIAKRLPTKDAIRTMFHELVHVKQHADGRLERGYVWYGQVYECVYNELPWEIEAYDLEEKMMEQFYGSH